MHDFTVNLMQDLPSLRLKDEDISDKSKWRRRIHVTALSPVRDY